MFCALNEIDWNFIIASVMAIIIILILFFCFIRHAAN